MRVKQNPPSFARIDEMNVAYEEYKGEVMIDILSSMNETLKSVKKDTSQIKQDTSNMLVKPDRMLEKQEDTIEAIDRSKDEIVTEISSLRETFL